MIASTLIAGGEKVSSIARLVVCAFGFLTFDPSLWTAQSDKASSALGDDALKAEKNNSSAECGDCEFRLLTEEEKKEFVNSLDAKANFDRRTLKIVCC